MDLDNGFSKAQRDYDAQTPDDRLRKVAGKNYERHCNNCVHLVIGDEPDDVPFCDAPLPPYIRQFMSAIPYTVSDGFNPEIDGEICDCFKPE